MKRYKIEYRRGNKSKLHWLTEIKKSGRRDGVRIEFWIDDSEVYSFQNQKKNKQQGIKIRCLR